MKMNPSQLKNVELFAAHGIGAIGEWRGATVEHIVWGAREAAEGQKAREAGEMSFISHAIEFGDGAHLQSLAVKVRLEDGVDHTKVDPTEGLKKGALVWVCLDKLLWTRGKADVEASAIWLLDNVQPA